MDLKIQTVQKTINKGGIIQAAGYSKLKSYMSGTQKKCCIQLPRT